MFVIGCVQGSLRYTDLDGNMYGKWAYLANHEAPRYQVVCVLLYDDIPKMYVDEPRGRYTFLRITSLCDMEKAYPNNYLDT